MIAREVKRKTLVDKYWQKRSDLKEIIKSSTDFETIMEAQMKLAKLPLNSNPVRHSTRCQSCGRPHAVYKKFKLCRICIRQQLMNGNIPGGRKSSW